VIAGLEVVSAAPLPSGRVGSPVDVEQAATGGGEMRTPSGPSGGGGGFGLGGLAQGRIQPISSLTPYLNRPFVIKGTVTLVEEARSFSRGDRSGKVMTIQIVDEVCVCGRGERACVCGLCVRGVCVRARCLWLAVLVPCGQWPVR
jgi:hypothetical protein